MESKNATDRHLKNGGDLDCNKCIVYRYIRCDKNEPFYIGIGKNISRAYSKKNRNKHWHNIVSKTNYEVEVLFENVSWEFAKEKEKEFIALYGRRDLNNGTLCNMTGGGEGVIGRSGKLHPLYGKKRSKEICEKISKSNKGKKLSKETRLNISKSKSGKNHFFYGKKLSESHIAKLVEKATGRKHSKKTRKKMCETRGNKVLHIPTGGVYRSLRYACEILNLKYNTELSRIHRDSSKKQFKYI